MSNIGDDIAQAFNDGYEAGKSDSFAWIKELQAEVESMDESCKKQLVAMASHVADLQAEVERLKDSNEELREKQTFIDHYGTEWMTSAKDVPTAAYKHGYADGRAEVKAQLPKRGEWIIDGAYTYNFRELNGKAYEPVYRCSCCNRQTESYVRLDEPKMPEDADFPEYCPHCGAKMGGTE